MNKRATQTGFSLVELILVILVAGIMIMVIANVTPTIGLINTSSRENIARQIVAKKMEDIRSQGYDNLANGTATISDTRISSLPQGSGQSIISDCPNTICVNNESIKLVKIETNWIENNKPKSFEVSTLVAKGGIR